MRVAFRVGIPVQQRIAGLVDGDRGGVAMLTLTGLPRSQRTLAGRRLVRQFGSGLFAAAAAVMKETHRGRVVGGPLVGNRRPFGGIARTDEVSLW